jgi:hypothetical protein
MTDGELCMYHAPRHGHWRGPSMRLALSFCEANRRFTDETAQRRVFSFVRFPSDDTTARCLSQVRSTAEEMGMVAPRSLICDAWSGGMGGEHLGSFVPSQNIRRLSVP